MAKKLPVKNQTDLKKEEVQEQTPPQESLGSESIPATPEAPAEEVPKTEAPQEEAPQPEPVNLKDEEPKPEPEAPVDPQPQPIIGKAPRKIDLIVMHCSDSDNPKHDNVKVIREWHTQRGFTGPDGIHGTEDDIGYHFVITQDGKIHPGRPVDEIGAHVKDHNAHSIGICLTGKKSFSSAQFRSARKLVDALLKDHRLDWKAVKLHNQLDKTKTCPNYKREDVISG